MGALQLREREDMEPLPRWKRLDSRTLVRTPSRTAGIESWRVPRITKIVRAASHGRPELAPIPTPWTTLSFSNCSTRWDQTLEARRSSGEVTSTAPPPLDGVEVEIDDPETDRTDAV